MNRKANAHFLYGFVYCAECGAPYKRRTIKGRDGVSFKMWNCSERQKGSKGNGCESPMIRENALLKTLSDSLGLGTDTGTDITIPADVLAAIQRIEVGKDGVKILRRETT